MCQINVFCLAGLVTAWASLHRSPSGRDAEVPYAIATRGWEQPTGVQPPRTPSTISEVDKAILHEADSCWLATGRH